MSIDAGKTFIPGEGRADRLGPVFVELVGFPGSGKTTVAKTAIAQLEIAGTSRPYFYGKDGKLRFDSADVGVFLAQISRAVASALRGGGPGAGVRQLRRFLPVVDKTLVFRRVRRRHRDDAVVLFDQGLIQKLYLLGDAVVPSRREMLPIMELLRPDLAEVTVFVDTPAEVAAQRYFARAKSSSRRPYKSWDEDRIAALYAAHMPVVQGIAEWLETTTRTHVLRLNGRLDPERNGAILARAIAEATQPAIPKGDPGRTR